MSRAAGMVVLPAVDPRVGPLRAAGWTVAQESWGARLDLTVERVEELGEIAASAHEGAALRELTPADVSAVLALDAATVRDYPGGPATAHAAFDRSDATPSPVRRGWGAFEDAGHLVGMTWVDLPADRGADPAEIDVTVVDAARRGRGIGTTLKAVSLLALAADGTRAVRTGGSAENGAILRSNARLGFVVDERWLTLTAPTTSPS